MHDFNEQNVSLTIDKVIIEKNGLNLREKWRWGKGQDYFSKFMRGKGFLF